MDAFNSCFNANKYEAEIQADFDLGQEMEVSGTPTVFVNGRRVGQGNAVPSYQEISDQVNSIAIPQ
jgi:protein-disulfide isomerase